MNTQQPSAAIPLSKVERELQRNIFGSIRPWKLETACIQPDFRQTSKETF